MRAIVAAALLMAGCSVTQVKEAQPYLDRIAAACRVAVPLAAIAPPVAPWIIGGCATEAAIAKLAADPSSLQWLDGLIANARRM